MADDTSSYFTIKDVTIFLFFFSLFGWFRGKIGIVYFDAAIFWFLMIAPEFYLHGKSLMNSWRYHSAQFIGPNIHGSISHDPVIIGFWALIALDGIDVGLRLKGKSRLCVVPAKSIKKIGDCWFTTTWTEKVSFAELPDDVENEVERGYYSKKNIHYGLFPVGYSFKDLKNQKMPNYFSKVSVDDITPEEVFSFVRRVENKNSMLSQMLQGKFKDFEDVAGFFERYAKRNETFLDKASAVLKGINKDDRD